ncbi:MAG: hypothetical protein WBB74_02390 [Gaiellaceae bacterium]
MRRLLAVVWLALLLAGCGGGKSTHPKTTSSVATKAAPSIRVTLTAQSHNPRVGKPWRYQVRVTDAAGRPVPADVHSQIVFAGTPVGQIGRHFVKSGIWKETIGGDGNAPFPAAARGHPLVFQVVVTAKGATVTRNWAILVR